MVIVRKRVAGLSEEQLARFVTRAARAAKVRGSVNILVTTSGELRSLNRRFRQHDRTTDVLSFPPPAAGGGFAGDVAISADIAARNARQLGHSPGEEVKILALHGLLHLAGHDHETDNGRMEALERRLRKSLSLPAGLIERAGGSAAAGKRGARGK